MAALLPAAISDFPESKHIPPEQRPSFSSVPSIRALIASPWLSFACSCPDRRLALGVSFSQIALPQAAIHNLREDFEDYPLQVSSSAQTSVFFFQGASSPAAIHDLKGSKLTLCKSHGPLSLMASMCSFVAYPLCLAKL